MTPRYLAAWPLRSANVLRRLGKARWPRLPRPTLSVGNIASGGRGKTPMTAILAELALARGLRPAILSRGYQGAVASRNAPLVLVGQDQDGPCWKRTLSAPGRTATGPQWSPQSGDEPAWLAATCAGVPVGIHPDRSCSARSVLKNHPVDLFLLDDGFQAVVQRDFDLVLLDPTQDPPFAQASLCREHPSALRRADQLAILDGHDSTLPEAALALPRLVRRPLSLRRLSSGEIVSPSSVGAVLIAAAVAEPGSVASGARELGLTVSGNLPIRDHGTPSVRRLRAGCKNPDAAILVTEKDAFGWAGRQALPHSTLVLSMELQGAAQLAERVLDSLTILTAGRERNRSR